jgi:gas vesicle protein
MENSNNNGKVLGALLLGAAIGGALGILFAPDKGSETRRKIVAKGDDFTDEVKNKFNDLMTEVRKEVEMVKDKTNKLIGNGMSVAEKAKNS